MVRFLFFIISIYLFARGWQTLPKKPTIQIIYSFAFWLGTVSFYIGQFLSDLVPAYLGIPLRQFQGIWLILFITFLFAAFFADFLRILNHWFGIFPLWLMDNYSLVKKIYVSTIAVILLISLLSGFRKYADPNVLELELTINKTSLCPTDINIVAASDFHLGNIIGKDKLAEWIKTINSQNPDVVLLVGDLFDSDFEKAYTFEISEELKKINSKFGIYAVLGNHEYYTDTKEVFRCLQLCGITLLRDEIAMPGNKLVLIGRDDYSNPKRKPIDSLMQGVDSHLPLVVMDHQPIYLKEVAKRNVDLQISGHLHNGQVYPMKKLIARLWELPYGYRKIKNTHFFVTAGLGLRRAAFRFGSQSEIVKITISSK